MPRMPILVPSVVSIVVDATVLTLVPSVVSSVVDATVLTLVPSVVESQCVNLRAECCESQCVNLRAECCESLGAKVLGLGVLVLQTRHSMTRHPTSPYTGHLIRTIYHNCLTMVYFSKTSLKRTSRNE